MKLIYATAYKSRSTTLVDIENEGKPAYLCQRWISPMFGKLIRQDLRVMYQVNKDDFGLKTPTLWPLLFLKLLNDAASRAPTLLWLEAKP